MNVVNEAIAKVEAVKRDRAHIDATRGGPVTARPVPMGPPPDQVERELGVGRHRRNGYATWPEPPPNPLDTTVTIGDMTFGLFALMGALVSSTVPLNSIVASLVEAAGAEAVLGALQELGHIQGYAEAE